MFEVLISSLDDKFRRVDTIERAVHMIMRHMEIMDARLQKSNNLSAAIFHRMDMLERRVSQCGSARQHSSSADTLSARSSFQASGDSLQRHLSSVEAHVSRLQRTLDGLEVSIVNADLMTPATTTTTSTTTSAGWAAVEQAKRATRYRTRDNQEELQQRFIKGAEKMSQTVDELRGKVVSMDNKLSYHMNQMSDSLTAIDRSVSTVSTSLLDPISITNSTRNKDNLVRSKFDVLLGKIEPLMEVSSKMDEVWHVVVGTKSSIDDLVPTSEQLLHTSNRQERAINNIKNDLHTTTREIIANIGMVEQKLSRQEDERVSSAYRIISADGHTADDFTDEAENDSEDQLRAAGSAFLGRTAETSKRFIRPATLPPRRSATDAPSSLTRWDKEVPFDLLDKEFLETYETSSTTTASPVLKAQGRGRPRGVVFPGRTVPPTTSNETTFTFLGTVPEENNVGAYSCQDFRERGMNKSGIYYIRIHGTTYWYLKVFCDMETDGGGWTVIQRRDDYGEHLQQTFSQSWEQYKQGFGEPTRDFWLGNENIFMLTNMEKHQLRVEVEDFEGEHRYAVYNKFRIHGESDNYKLEIDEYSGTAGDSMNDPWYGSNLSPFSTFDRDNDRSSLNCANMLKGGWWWRSCGRGLNGLYLTEPNDAIARQGIVWYRWRGWDYSLRRSVMMIRPLRDSDDTSTQPPTTE